MSSIIPNFAFKLRGLGLLAGKRQVSLPVSETTIAEKNLSDSVYSVYSVVQKITQAAGNAGGPLRVGEQDPFTFKSTPISVDKVVFAPWNDDIPDESRVYHVDPHPSIR